MKKTAILLICILAIFACTKPPVRLTADQSMQKGLAYFQKKDYDLAVPMFENTIMEADNPDIAAKAQLFLADSYFLSKKYTEAIPAYEQYLDIYSGNDDAKVAMLRLGLSHYALIDKVDRDMGAVEGALKNFTALREKDPAFAKEYDMTKKIVELRDMLAERELYVAKFYFRIKQPQAGAKRLEYLMDKYKDSSSYEEGLYLYAGWLAGQDGREADALKYYQQLLKEKPDSVYAKDVAGHLVELLARVTNRLVKEKAAAQQAQQPDAQQPATQEKAK